MHGWDWQRVLGVEGNKQRRYEMTGGVRGVINHGTNKSDTEEELEDTQGRGIEVYTVYGKEKYRVVTHRWSRERGQAGAWWVKGMERQKGTLYMNRFKMKLITGSQKGRREKKRACSGRLKHVGTKRNSELHYQ